MKFYIALLSLMLVIVLVFTAFGIPYAKNNFVGTVVTVEGYLNDFSGWLMNLYKTIHNLIDEWLPKIADTLRPLGDLIKSIDNAFKKLDEKFGILDSISNFLNDTLVFIKKIFGGLSIAIDYFSEYGFNFLNSEWKSGLSTALKCAHDDLFYNEDGSLNSDKIFKYVEAVVYLEENEFSYLLKDYGKNNILDFVDDTEPKTVVRFYTSQFDEYSCLFAFTTVDLSLPRNYLPDMLEDFRYKSYFENVWIPVIDGGDFDMFIDDIHYYFSAFKLFTPNLPPANLFPYLNGETSYVNFFATAYNFQFHNRHRSIYCRYFYYDDVGKKHTKFFAMDEVIAWYEKTYDYKFVYFVKIEDL